jgi:hypothetical protein
VPHGTANQHNLQLDESAHGNLFGAKKKHACGANVSGNQGYGEIFLKGTHAAEAQRKF